MENIQISTTQNVVLHYQAAGLGLRLLAILLDTIFKYVYFFIIIMLFYTAFYRSKYVNGYAVNENADNGLMLGFLVLCLLPGLLYHLLCETFLNGQSFGKKIVKIKVVKLDGTQPNFGSYLVRSMFRILDDGIIGIIVIAASRQSQRVGDMVAGTTVIELNKKMSLNDTILHRQKPDHVITYSQVSTFSDKDVNIIREVLKFAAEQQQPEHLKALAEKIKKKYGIHQVQQKDADFLNTLLADYSHYRFEA